MLDQTGSYIDARNKRRGAAKGLPVHNVEYYDSDSGECIECLEAGFRNLFNNKGYDWIESQRM